jgi:hypothetical protein
MLLEECVQFNGGYSVTVEILRHASKELMLCSYRIFMETGIWQKEKKLKMTAGWSMYLIVE